MEHTYEISGMKCGNCVGKVTDSLKEVPGIKEVNVTLTPPKATINMNSHIPTEELDKAVKRAGNYSLKEENSLHHIAATKETKAESLKPLFIIVGYILGGVLLRASLTNIFSLHAIMTNFMGGFFIVFSLFKMIDLSGFADGYSTYDIIAKRSRVYALTYPFVELFLGVSYFSFSNLYFVNILTIIIMGVSSIGVFQALLEKRTIQCACLGTALKLPMTKVTLLEDLLMVFMAAAMLI